MTILNLFSKNPNELDAIKTAITMLKSKMLWHHAKTPTYLSMGFTIAYMLTKTISAFENSNSNKSIPLEMILAALVLSTFCAKYMQIIISKPVFDYKVCDVFNAAELKKFTHLLGYRRTLISLNKEISVIEMLKELKAAKKEEKYPRHSYHPRPGGKFDGC